MTSEYSCRFDFLERLPQAQKLTSCSEKALANQFLALAMCQPQPGSRCLPPRWYSSGIWSELLGMVSAGEPELDVKKRTGWQGPEDEKQSAAELDHDLQQRQNLQEKQADEMHSLARSLKTNTLASQSVIKDNQTLSHSLKMADQTLEKLMTESERWEQQTQESVHWVLHVHHHDPLCPIMHKLR